ncbi:MAG TPA: UbiA family prenyltransferase [Pirellulales bacterium]|nr:UbiA family prenyltransferase [Pirellulales bacterium]
MEERTVPPDDASNEPPPPADRLRAYLQLFRTPNVFTAIADLTMGYLFVRPRLEPPQYYVPLLLASGLMYTAGMVLNDVFDIEIDRVERPERPLPSGRIELGWARQLGFEMLSAGAALAVVVAVLLRDWRPAGLAVGLAALIVLYNRVLKATFLGPIAMGGCRFLNVLLGMSAASAAWEGNNYLIAGGIGIYIVGVSWFARGEAEDDIHRGPLFWGTILMALGIVLLASYPRAHWTGGQDVAAVFRQHPENLAWLLLAFTIGFRTVRAIVQPYSVFVQEAVRYCLMSLITFDAIITFAHSESIWLAGGIFALVLPMTILGRWSYST